VELENDRVRVLRVAYGPREKSVMHSHPDGIAVFLTDQHSRFTLPDGKSEENRFIPGQTMWFPAGSHFWPHLGRVEIAQAKSHDLTWKRYGGNSL